MRPFPEDAAEAREVVERHVGDGGEEVGEEGVVKGMVVE
jgi:hypothetical protein